MSTEIDSVQETGPSTAVNVTQQIAAAALFNAGAASALQAGSRPTYQRNIRQDMLTRAPLMFDSSNLTKLEGFDEHGSALATSVAALDGLKAVIDSVVTARKKVATDPELAHNEVGQILRVADYADKLSTPATQKLDAAHKHVTNAIAATEAELNKALTTSSHSTLATEVRAFSRSHKSPVQFVAELIAANDESSVSAILGAAPFLSGLTAQMREALVRQWNAKRQPALSARLTMLQAAQERLERAGSNFMTTLEKAQGVDYGVIGRFRTAKSAAALG